MNAPILTYTPNQIRQMARACFRGRVRSNIPVEFTRDAAPPRLRGRGWHYKTKGGTPITYPSAYSRWGWSNMVYIPSTQRIIVGQYWKPMSTA